ncbi:PilC/PilY family type IV pilus protein [Ignatzschineria sp. RMDPL8A]|uniref:PilC/PilY family type IV pilus protein n=1 Tax=Ignatzschineria sp. RMDPL8A TaxID=2999236 RepID=UPI0024467A03|nr:PilC/PilY family type IV pilus protein [Ignatzschineria sp. RMDPL8A]MDG9730425.1 PilC/PilY family type IV pilus protein [Ignatzschineria sp. RMDPL8A]
MKKRLSLALGTALLMSQFGFAQESTGFKPHHEPLIKQNPPKPNILMILDTSGSMREYDMGVPCENGYPGEMCSDSRINVLRSTVDRLLARYRNDAYLGISTLGKFGYHIDPRFGYRNDLNIIKHDLSDLSTSDDPRINTENAAKLRSIQNTVKGLQANGGTPLAFALYEAAKYFRGDKLLKETNYKYSWNDGRYAHFDSFIGVKPSPIKYRCQAQHIVLLTDGDPDVDQVGQILPRDKSALQRLSNLNSVRNRAAVRRAEIERIARSNPRNQIIQRYYQTVLTQDRYNGSDYLGNFSTSFIAQHLWNLDLRTDTQNLATKDNAGKGWLDEGSVRMPIYVNAITFGDDTNSTSKKELDLTVAPSGGVHVHAKNPKQLDDAFNDIFQSIIQTRSGTGAVEDQNAQTLNTIRYTTSYEPRVWTGAIVARRYDSKTGKFSIPVWDTKERIKPGQGKLYTAEIQNRNVITKELTEGKWIVENDRRGRPKKPFWVNGYYGALGEQYVRWLKGYDDPELRDRQGNTLGAIINSDIYHFSSDMPNVNINETVVGKAHRDNIIKYVKKRRDTMGINYLITGSNDGLINFIVAEKTDSSKRSELPGTRIFSYFPSFFKDDLADITSVPYSHQYKVDGTTHFFDALVDDHYRTIGITSMGSGARALVGYQVFESDSEFKKTSDDFKINFEITNKTAGFENLGYTYSEVDYVNQAKDDKHSRAVAVFGNGFGAPSKVSSIYMIDAITGQKIEEIVLSNNGLGAASPSLLVSKDPVTKMQRLESIYVGDYSGNMYKIVFDYTASDKEGSYNFKHYSKQTIFQSGGSTRPITTRPVVMKNKKDNDQVWVYFGTGSAKTANDISEKALNAQHYFYGIKDINETIEDGQLIEQKVEKTFGTGKERQLLTSKAVDGATTPYGWKLKLTHRSDENNERVIRPAVLVGNKYITFATWSIVRGGANDPCLSDNLVGSEFTLDLYTGNAGTIFWETNPDGSLKGIDKDGQGEPIRAKYNGEHLDDDAFGRPTGEGIIPHNIYGGNYYYGFIEELASSDGYYVDLSKDSGNQSGMAIGGATISGKNGGKFSSMSSTTEGGKQKNKLILQDDIWESEDELISGKRLYIKQRAI